MGSGRVLGLIGCLLSVAAPCWAQSVALTEPIAVGDCFAVQIRMHLSGEMRIIKAAEPVPLTMSADARHEVRERVLSLTSTGLVEKSARIYDDAAASITVGTDKTDKILRPERKLIVAQRQRDGLLAYCPTAALTRAELDLTCDHFDLLSLVGLLPGKEVAVGDTWKITNAAAQGLCNFEGLTEQTLTGKLESVKDGVAFFTVTGTANGIDMGALAKLTIEAQGQFDLKSKRLVQLDWRQKDDRDAGPVSPATKVETRTSITRKPIEQPSDLSDAALVSIPDQGDPKPNQTQLEFRDGKDRFELTYGREWQIVSQNASRLIMRLMERGDFIAQVTITPWDPAEKGKPMTLEQFRETMNSTPGWSPEKELQAGEVPAAAEGRKILRLSMLGKLDGVNVMQNFYLVATAEGQQIVVAFTLTPKQADKLGARDLSLVTSMEVPAPARK